MKYLKTFEDIEDKLQIGEYVICTDSALKNFDDEKETITFLANNIGHIIRYSNAEDEILSKYKYLVIYEKVPKNIMHNFNMYDRNNKHIKYFRTNNEKIGRAFSDDEIIVHSPNKKDLEIILQQNKYNL